MSATETTSTWRKCSNCKDPISFGQRYYRCSVSTCNRQKAPLQFCCVECWEAHVPTMRHRESWAEEERAPTHEQARREQLTADAKSGVAQVVAPGTSTPPSQTASEAPRRRYVSVSTDAPRAATDPRAGTPHEVLIIASRLKAYIRARCGMSTSDRVLDPLSDIVRALCDEAIERARREGRSTVLDRDVPRR